MNMMSADSVLIFASLFPTSVSAMASARTVLDPVQFELIAAGMMLLPPAGPIAHATSPYHELSIQQRRAVREVDARLQRQAPVVHHQLDLERRRFVALVKIFMPRSNSWTPNWRCMSRSGSTISQVSDWTAAPDETRSRAPA